MTSLIYIRGKVVWKHNSNKLDYFYAPMRGTRIQGSNAIQELVLAHFWTAKPNCSFVFERFASMAQFCGLLPWLKLLNLVVLILVFIRIPAQPEVLYRS